MTILLLVLVAIAFTYVVASEHTTRRAKALATITLLTTILFVVAYT